MVPPKYDNVSLMVDKNGVHEYFEVKNKDKYGVYSIDGKEIIDTKKYQRIIYSEDNKYVAFYDNNKNYSEFSINGTRTFDSYTTTQCMKYAELADEAYRSGNYGKAAKNYSKAISYEPSATLYFNRGLANYKKESYGSAKNDFKEYLHLDPGGDLSSRARELYDSAEELHKEKKARRAEMWGNIIASVVLVGAQVANTYMQTK